MAAIIAVACTSQAPLDRPDANKQTSDCSGEGRVVHAPRALLVEQIQGAEVEHVREIDAIEFASISGAQLVSSYVIDSEDEAWILSELTGGDPSLAVSFSRALLPYEGQAMSFKESKTRFPAERAAPDILAKRSAYARPFCNQGYRANVYTAALRHPKLPEGSLGLFAGEDIPEGTMIGVYLGRVLRVDDAKVAPSDYTFALRLYRFAWVSEPGGAMHLSSLREQVDVDAAQFRNEMAHINHSEYSNTSAIWVSDGYLPYIALVTHVAVPKDRQLTLNYNPGYWAERIGEEIRVEHAERIPLRLPPSHGKAAE